MKQLGTDSKIGFMIHTYGPIDPKVYYNHIGHIMNWGRKYDMAFLGIDKYRAADARNILVDTAISLNCTHILSIDADHIIPAHMLECLSKNEDASIVSGLITKRKPPYSQVGFVLVKGNYYPVNLPIDGRSYKVDIPAMGCTLIDVAVFEKLEKPYFHDSTEVAEEGKRYNKRSDLNFFEACKDAGFTALIDTRVLIGHMRDAEPVFPNAVPNARELNKQNRIHKGNDALKYQCRVYEKAHELSMQDDDSGYKYLSFCDLGCGNPAKIAKCLYFMDRIVGVDLPNKILDIAALGVENDGNARWIGQDLNEVFNLGETFGMLISADVIEHLDTPGNLLETAKNHMTKDSIFVISSPEKTTTKQDNPLHVREFSIEELSAIIHAHGLTVIEHEQYIEDSGDVPYTNNICVCKLSSKE
jgi:2-polyprenyl-3-methyl-5-hydroxy-6-metoxy-1,4-benzoquinol methylase